MTGIFGSMRKIFSTPVSGRRRSFRPSAFKTRFFICVCPPKQTPYAAITELQNVEFIEPKQALARWSRSEVLISPPVLISLKELAAAIEPQRRENNEENSNGSRQDNFIFNPRSSATDFSSSAPVLLCGEKLLEKSQDSGGDIHHIELNPRIIGFPLRTETLPPATHTNCFIVGKQEFVVIDAASKNEAEQRKLLEFVDSFIEKGFRCREIVVSHLHKDHFGGEIVLKNHLREKFGLDVSIAAHEITAESLRDMVKIDRFVKDEEVFHLKDENGAAFELKALHTPGHARGHLCFYDAEFGFLLSSDNVVSLGTVVIAPPEGDMTDYLASLERMKNLPNLRFLCGSHGAAVFDAKGKIEEYVAHRKAREAEIFEAFQSGERSAAGIVAVVYKDLNPLLFPLAEKSVQAHLEKLRREGKI